MRFTLSVFVTLAVASGIAVAQDASPSAAKDALDKASIPTDLHLKEFKPTAVLQVSFPGSAQPASKLPPPSSQSPPPASHSPPPALQSPPPATPVSHGGAQLPQNDTANPPTFGLRAPGKPVNIGKGPFVIAIVDIDAPTPQNPVDGPVRHFLGGGFTFKDDGVSLTNNTPAVTEYQPPSPPQGSNPHRCVFLLFNQPDGFKDQKEVGPDTSRTGFNVSQFAANVGLGAPVAGTYALVAAQK